jgi:hypothetical protein
MARHFQQLKDQEVGKWQSVAMQAQNVIAELQGRLSELNQDYEQTLEPGQRLERRLRRLEQSLGSLAAGGRTPLEVVLPAGASPAGEAPAAPAGGPAPLLPMLQALVQGEGIDPSDPDLDWAGEVRDPYEGLARWARSLARLVDKRAAKKAEAQVVRLRQELGLDAVDTQGPSVSSRGASRSPHETIRSAWG